MFCFFVAFHLRKLYDRLTHGVSQSSQLIDCLHPERLGERRVAFRVFHPEIHDVTQPTEGVKVF